MGPSGVLLRNGRFRMAGGELAWSQRRIREWGDTHAGPSSGHIGGNGAFALLRNSTQKGPGAPSLRRSCFLSQGWDTSNLTKQTVAYNYPPLAHNIYWRLQDDRITQGGTQLGPLSTSGASRKPRKIRLPPPPPPFLATFSAGHHL